MTEEQLVTRQCLQTVRAVLVGEPIVELPMLVASEDETPVAVPETAADPEAALAEVPPGLSMRRSE